MSNIRVSVSFCSMQSNLYARRIIFSTHTQPLFETLQWKLWRSNCHNSFKSFLFAMADSQKRLRKDFGGKIFQLNSFTESSYYREITKACRGKFLNCKTSNCAFVMAINYNRSDRRTFGCKNVRQTKSHAFSTWTPYSLSLLAPFVLREIATIFICAIANFSSAKSQTILL